MFSHSFRLGAMTAAMLLSFSLLGGLPGGVLAADDAEAGDHSASAGETRPGADAGHDTRHDGGGHSIDPYNKTEANASASLEDPKEIRYELAICTLVVFVLLAAVLARFAWGPIVTGLERREQSITNRIEEAERSADEAAAQLRAYREKLASASEEAQQILHQARNDAEKAADVIRQQAQADAARERERALAEIQLAKNAAVNEVAERAADLAVGLAGQIVRRELKPEEHAALISEAVDRFASNN